MQPTRLFDFIEFQRQQRPLENTINTKYNGTWEGLSSQAFYDQGELISSAQYQMGIKKGDKIALISSNNRTEWAVVDLGALQLGAVTVPIYPTITA